MPGGRSRDPSPPNPRTRPGPGSRCGPWRLYDEPCGFVAAAGSGRAAAAAARLGADIVAALATRQYETESLSKSLLDVYEEVNLFYGITARMHRVGTTDGICATILDRACEIVKGSRGLRVL